MLDPMTALGLASNIVQVISFTAEVVREANHLVQAGTGTAPSCDQILRVAKQQQEACHRLIVQAGQQEQQDAGTNGTTTPPAITPDPEYLQAQRNLQVLASGCKTEAARLVQMLQSLVVVPRKDGKVAFGPALLNVARAKMKRGEIERAHKTLQQYQSDLNLALLGLIRAETQMNADNVHSTIRKTNEQQIQAVLDVKESLLTAFQDTASASESLLLGLNERLGPSEEVKSSKSDHKREKGPHSSQSRKQDGGKGPSETETSDSDGESNFKADEPHMDEVQSSSDELDAVRRKGSKKPKKMTRQEKEKRVATTIFRSLDFQEIRSRENAISPAHSKTFAWMFESESSPIQDWMKSERDLFWISGKAGSGKSTLMKYIRHHPQTTNLLRQWAGHETPLVVIDIYFWYLGTYLQKSEEGLLRTMLLSILRKSRDLIPVAAPDRWATVSKVRRRWEVEDYRHAAGAPWTTSMLRDALDRIGACTSGYKFAFFIDGLDEYEADHHSLIKLLLKLQRNPEFKFCMSSRPWNVFERAFGSRPDMFVLQDLTSLDIRNYVQSELAEYADEQPDVDKLVDEVVRKAEGVFLWVFLTTRSLREGYAEGDNARLLRQRVEMLPSDLSQYFDLILSRVNPVYQKLTATALHFSLSAVSSAESAESHTLLKKSFLNYWMLQDGLEDRAYAFEKELVNVDVARWIAMVTATRKFINACCKDLLHIPKPGSSMDPASETFLTRFQVEFLHRTVYEFLQIRDINERLRTDSLPLASDPALHGILALARLKSAPSNLPARCVYLEQELDGLCTSDSLFQLGPVAVIQVDDIATKYLEGCETGECAGHSSPFVIRELLVAEQFRFVTALLHRWNKRASEEDSHPSPVATNLVLSELLCLKRLNDTAVSLVQNHLRYLPNDSQRELWHRFLWDWVEIAQSADGTCDPALLWRIAKTFLEQGANIFEKIERLPGHPFCSRVLVDLVAPVYQQELRTFMDTQRADAESTRRRIVQSKIEDKMAAARKKEEDEDYYRRTGFRP